MLHRTAVLPIGNKLLSKPLMPSCKIHSMDQRKGEKQERAWPVERPKTAHTTNVSVRTVSQKKHLPVSSALTSDAGFPRLHSQEQKRLLSMACLRTGGRKRAVFFLNAAVTTRAVEAVQNLDYLKLTLISSVQISHCR